MKNILMRTGSSIADYVLFIAIFLAPHIAAAQAVSENVGTKLTSGRLESLAILAVGILSVVLGRRSMKRSVDSGFAINKWGNGVIAAMASGLICVIFSVIHLANTRGGFGTGGGKAGAIVAILVGSIGVILALITFYRIRNNSKY